jgi:hypothetical protein
MRQFALSDAARVKLNSELARHKSRQRFAATTAFVVAPQAQCTQSSRSQALWSFETDGVIRLHTIMPVEKAQDLHQSKSGYLDYIQLYIALHKKTQPVHCRQRDILKR